MNQRILILNFYGTTPFRFTHFSLLCFSLLTKEANMSNKVNMLFQDNVTSMLIPILLSSANVFPLAPYTCKVGIYINVM